MSDGYTTLANLQSSQPRAPAKAAQPDASESITIVRGLPVVAVPLALVTATPTKIAYTGTAASFLTWNPGATAAVRLTKPGRYLINLRARAGWTATKTSASIQLNTYDQLGVALDNTNTLNTNAVAGVGAEDIWLSRAIDAPATTYVTVDVTVTVAAGTAPVLTNSDIEIVYFGLPDRV